MSYINICEGKRIAYVITRSDAVGGAHVHVADVAERIQQKGAKVVVFVGGEGPFTDLLRGKKVPYISLKYLCRPIQPLWDVMAFWELRHEFSRFKPDLITAHSAKAGLITRLAAKKARYPVVFTAHGWSFTEGISPIKRKLYEHLERYAAPLSRLIITVSEYDRNLALDNKVACDQRIRTVHNGMPDIPAAKQAQPGTAGPRLICVARLDDPKDHFLLIMALSKLKSLPWSLELVGDGPRETDVRQLVAKVGLEGRVSFLGRRTDVADVLAKSAIFVLPSNWEGLPLCIIEAMRARLPVVASSVGGVPELVQNAVTGYLVGRGDVEGLAERLKRLIIDPKKREIMGRAGRALYEESFHFERMFEKTVLVYKEAMESQWAEQKS